MKSKKTYIIISLIVFHAVVIPLSIGKMNARFGNHSEKRAYASFHNKNLITNENFTKLDNPLLVFLKSEDDSVSDKQNLVIPASEILEEKNLKKLQKHKGDIVIKSNDPSLSARVWMVLSQLGIRNIYILEQ